MFVKFSTCLILLLTEISSLLGFVFPESSCDPFTFGTSSDSYNAAISYGVQYPYQCLCTYPCTSSTASLYVRFFYLKNGESNYHVLSATASSIITSTDRARPIKFLLHDYADKVQFNGTGWMEPTGKALANAIDGLVILVDWGLISNCNYTRTVSEIVPSIGYYLAQVISSPGYLGLDPSKIELIGHGLGGHIAGYAGAALNGAINKITALDPTGDSFPSGGLSSSRASFVQVLHTNTAKYGTNKLLGSADFFANRGSEFQPGCTSNYCSHTKAVFYYYASIPFRHSFRARKCDLCTFSKCTSHFGLYNGRASGVFCFSTASCFPYHLPSTTTTTTATTPKIVYVYPVAVQPPPPLPASPPPKPARRKCRRRRWCRRQNRRCQRPCRKRCRRNCRCCRPMK